MRRVIMHLDLDAFFCAVEELLNPVLRGKAFVVGGSPTSRGVVSSASYPARRHGVHSAMPTAQALRVCPNLIVVGHRHGVYGKYSTKVMTLLHEYTNVLQQISVDEAWFDMTGFENDPHALGLEIQKRIAAEVHLPASIGIATSKLVAKVASSKAKPNGVLLISEGSEAAFLAPMSAGDLWGIGEATAKRLRQIGVLTIGDLQRASAASLQRAFGNQAESVIARAHGIDESAVTNDGQIKNISEENTFARDVADEHQLRNELLSQCDRVAARLRKHNLHARTVHLKLRWPDFSTITRQTTLTQPTQLSDALFAAIEKLWRQNWKDRDYVRLIGVGVSSFSRDQQITLLDQADRDSKHALATVIDGLRGQYGDRIVERASLKHKPNSWTQYNTPFK